MAASAAPPLLPSVELEARVYPFGNPDNGSGPMWCYGSTCLARLGGQVFASGLEILPDHKPLNNVRWTLHQLSGNRWRLVQADPEGRQREPCPLGVFPDGRLLLTSNPTLTKPGDYNGPARPQLLAFDTRQLTAPPTVSLPRWEGEPAFTEHSYRGFCVDGPSREALYLQNVGYDTSYWSFLDREGKWSACGKITAPWGAEFEKPEAIRVCYQNLALRNRAAHLLGVSDIIEWVKGWREYKLILHEGKTWDYDFRRLYYCYTPDLTRQPFGEWVKVADCDATCGHITNLDLWLDKQGRAHLLWLEQSVWDTRVRDKFFPEAPQTYALMYGVIDRGKVTRKVRLAFGGEKQESQLLPGFGRFQATPDGRLFVFYYTSGTDAAGRPVNENRLLELYPDGTASAPVRVGLENPLTSFMTATERGGSAPSGTLDLLGVAPGVEGISYARVNLLNDLLAEFDCRVSAAPDANEVSVDASASRSAERRITSYSWQFGETPATGVKATQKVRHGGPLRVRLTVKDSAGHTATTGRTLLLPPTPYDLGLKQWGLVLRVEAESFAAEGGGEIHVRQDKLNASGLSLSHADAKGHWLQWSFAVPLAGRYYLLSRYAVPTVSARLLSLDGAEVGEYAFPATGGYGSGTTDNWGLVTLQRGGRPLALTLAAGQHSLRLTNANGLGLNLDYFELVAAEAPFPAAAPAGWRAAEAGGRRHLWALEGTLAPTQIRPELQSCYNYTLGPQFVGDGGKDAPPSALRLFEDGKELGPAHAPHAEIRAAGKGRYSHWSTVLYFSASDNSDPRTNGRTYTWRLE